MTDEDASATAIQEAPVRGMSEPSSRVAAMNNYAQADRSSGRTQDSLVGQVLVLD
jgi:hypothetical protein